MFDQNRQEVGWDDVSQFVKDAVVSTEDPRFYEHHGVDIASTLRAAVGNVASGGVESGASTITMQYVRNILVQQAEMIDDPAERQAKIEEIQAKVGELLSTVPLLQGAQVAVAGSGIDGVILDASFKFRYAPLTK